MGKLTWRAPEPGTEAASPGPHVRDEKAEARRQEGFQSPALPATPQAPRVEAGGVTGASSPQPWGVGVGYVPWTHPPCANKCTLTPCLLTQTVSHRLGYESLLFWEGSLPRA